MSRGIGNVTGKTVQGKETKYHGIHKQYQDRDFLDPDYSSKSCEPENGVPLTWASVSSLIHKGIFLGSPRESFNSGKFLDLSLTSKSKSPRESLHY